MGIQAHRASLEIDLAPLERQDLALDAPAGHEGEPHDSLQRLRQMTADNLDHRIIEESRPNVTLLQKRNLRHPAVIPLILHGQTERAPNDRELAIHFRRRGAGLEPIRRERTQIADAD